MAYGRVVRPPSPAATLASVDESGVRQMPGVLAVVLDGSFLGVVAERESQAISAADVLRRRASWTEPETLPPAERIPAWLRISPAKPSSSSTGRPRMPLRSRRTSRGATWRRIRGPI